MTFHQPSGITQGLSLFIDANWTPAQAWAVIELLDDLRERLHAHYQLALAAWLTEDRQVHPDGRDDDLHDNDFRSNHKGPAGPLDVADCASGPGAALLPDVISLSSTPLRMPF